MEVMNVFLFVEVQRSLEISGLYHPSSLHLLPALPLSDAPLSHSPFQLHKRRTCKTNAHTRHSSRVHPSKGLNTPGWKPQARLGRASPTSNAAAGAGAIGFGRRRPRRADSPRHGPYPNSFLTRAGSNGGGGGGGVSRGPSSRGSSPASSRFVTALGGSFGVLRRAVVRGRAVRLGEISLA